MQETYRPKLAVANAANNSITKGILGPSLFEAVLATGGHDLERTTVLDRQRRRIEKQLLANGKRLKKKKFLCFVRLSTYCHQLVL